MSRLAALTLWGRPEPEGPLSISFELSQAWPPDVVAQIELIVRAFANVGEAGGYPRGGAAAMSSKLQLVAGPRCSGAVLEFELLADAVDGRAFQFLRHMAGRVEFRGAVLRRIQVRELRAVALSRLDMPLVDYANEGVAYPSPPPSYVFPVDWSELTPSKFRRVLVEAGAKLERKHFDLLREPINRWARLLEGGAFALPCGHPDVLENVMGQLALFDATTAVIEVPVYLSSEVGWECLLNLLDAFSQRTLAIARVEID